MYKLPGVSAETSSAILGPIVTVLGTVSFTWFSALLDTRRKAKNSRNRARGAIHLLEEKLESALGKAKTAHWCREFEALELEVRATVAISENIRAQVYGFENEQWCFWYEVVSGLSRKWGVRLEDELKRNNNKFGDSGFSKVPFQREGEAVLSKLKEAAKESRPPEFREPPRKWSIKTLWPIIDEWRRRT